MKKLLAFRTIGLSILLTTTGLFSASTAFAGGGGTGGGTELEAAFKATGITLAKELALYPSQATALLKFQANDLLGAAYTASPTCATGQDLQYIKDQMKLAYVKGGNVILLNCYKDSPSELNLKPDWQDLLNSLVKETKLSIQSQILVAHELLRTINAEGENSYLSSGNSSRCRKL